MVSYPNISTLTEMQFTLLRPMRSDVQFHQSYGVVSFLEQLWSAGNEKLGCRNVFHWNLYGS